MSEQGEPGLLREGETAGKAAVDKMAHDMGVELRAHGESLTFRLCRAVGKLRRESYSTLCQLGSGLKVLILSAIASVFLPRFFW